MSLLVSIILSLRRRGGELNIFVVVIIRSGEGALDARSRAFMVT